MRLSIITVTYNNIAGLMKTCNSISPHLNNKKFHIEHIIIDGDSNDGTKSYVARKLRENISSILFISEGDSGIYDAMNKGIRLTSVDSDYCYFLNAGDTLLSEFGDTVSSIAISQSFKVFRVVSTDANFRKISIRRHKPADLIHGPAVPHQGVLIPTTYHRANLYDDSYKILADYDFFCSALVNGVKFELINEEIANFEHGGISSNRKYASVWYAEIRRIQRDHFGKTSFKMQARFLLKYVYQHIPFSHKLEPIIRRIFL